MSRLLALLASATAFVLAACSGGVVADQAGGPGLMTTLRLGTIEHEGNNQDPAVGWFKDRVHELSGGAIDVQLTFGVSGDEQDLVQKVRAGDFELGMSATRVFDLMGVESMQALQAPFLIDSEAVLGQVATGPIPGEMLAGLAELELVGLAIYPYQLRHPMGLGRPLASLADLKGARMSLPASNASDAMWRALGAVPQHMRGVELDEALAKGTIDGRESGMNGDTGLPGAFVASNVTIYPRMDVLFLSKRAANVLTKDQQALLRQAAADVIGRSVSTLSERDDADAFCAAGGHVVLADPRDLDAMVAATAPVRASMEQDATTRDFIVRIQALRTSNPAPLAAPTCGGGAGPTPTAESSATATPSTTPVDLFPAGTYTSVATRQDALRSGAEDECALSGKELHLKLVIGNGRYNMYAHCDKPSDEQSIDIGTYVATATTIENAPNFSPSNSTVYSWTVDDGALTLRVVDESNSPTGDIPYNHFLYEHEWTPQ